MADRTPTTVMQNEQPDAPRTLEPGWLTIAYPRCIHVGRCGGLSFRLDATIEPDAVAGACNATSDLLAFVRAWVEPWLEGGVFAGASLSEPALSKNPRTTWRVDDGLAKCRAKYRTRGKGSPLVGVANSSRTTPQTVERLCRSILEAKSMF